MAGTTRYGGIPKARREALGLTQYQLAGWVGCSVTLIRLVEGGYRPSEKYRHAYARQLETTADVLWPED